MKDKNKIFGIRPVIEALNSGKHIDKIFLKNALSGELFNELFNLIRATKTPFQYVPIERLNRTTSKNHQGVIAFLPEIEYSNIEDIIPFVYENKKNPLILLLDKITDVRNFGAIARTAECSGVDAIIIPTRNSAQINADAIKTSAGALHKIPVCKIDDLFEAIIFLKESGLQIVSVTEKTENDYYSVDYTKPTALIMGSEDKGISPKYIKMSDELAKIPLQGEIESLNVSVACGIVLFEAVKQRV